MPLAGRKRERKRQTIKRRTRADTAHTQAQAISAETPGAGASMTARPSLCVNRPSRSDVRCRWPAILVAALHHHGVRSGQHREGFVAGPTSFSAELNDNENINIRFTDCEQLLPVRMMRLPVMETTLFFCFSASATTTRQKQILRDVTHVKTKVDFGHSQQSCQPPNRQIGACVERETFLAVTESKSGRRVFRQGRRVRGPVSAIVRSVDRLTAQPLRDRSTFPA